MSAIPSQVLSAIEASAHHRRRAIILRHAERHPVLDLATHETVLLTDDGQKAAHAAGRELHAAVAARGALVVRHSPVERCAQTARGLVAGFIEAGGRARLVGPEPVFATPYVKDRGRAYALVNGMGHDFIRAWFDGAVPEDCFARRHHAASEQIVAALRAVRSSSDDETCVFVTHDWNIALVREEFLQVRHEEFGWPGYLDGVCLTDDDDAVELAVGDRRARVDPAALV